MSWAEESFDHYVDKLTRGKTDRFLHVRGQSIGTLRNRKRKLQRRVVSGEIGYAAELEVIVTEINRRKGES